MGDMDGEVYNAIREIQNEVYYIHEILKDMNKTNKSLLDEIKGLRNELKTR